MKKRKLLLMLAMVLAAVGCKERKQSSLTSEKTEQIMRVNCPQILVSLNPHTGIDLQCRIFQKALFEGLTRINLEGKPELAAAEKVEISPSQLTYTFTLRPHQWTNGEKVTALHFEKAWKEALAPNSNCLRADLFYPIKNAALAKKGKVSLDEVGIYAPSQETLIVELEHPAPYFLDLAANPLFSPLFDGASAPKIFNGPFRIRLYEPEKILVLEKNPLYWDADHVALEQISCSFIADPMTAVMLYEKGELDWVGHPLTNLPIDAIPLLEKSKDYHFQPIAGMFWLCLNTDSFPLNSAKIRKALSFAINRTSLTQHVLLGETPTKNIIHSNLRSLKNEDDNQKMAKSLFQEGLKELNLSLAEFPPLTFSYSEIANQNKIAETIQQCWEKTFSIKVHLHKSEWNVFFARLGEKQYQIGGCNWYAAFNDPIYFLEFFKDKSHRYNACQWENKHYQQLLRLADAETSQEIRREHLKQAEELLLDEMPIIPIYVANAKYLKAAAVKNLNVSALGQIDFKWAYVDKECLGSAAKSNAKTQRSR